MPGWGVDGELQGFCPQTLLSAPSRGELFLSVPLYPPSWHKTYTTAYTHTHTHTHTRTQGIPTHCDCLGRRDRGPWQAELPCPFLILLLWAQAAEPRGPSGRRWGLGSLWELAQGSDFLTCARGAV